MTSSLEAFARVPKMVVFDLGRGKPTVVDWYSDLSGYVVRDYTLWPFWVDTHVNPPFHKNSAGKVVDYRGSVIKHYPGTPKVLKFLWDNEIGMSIASRTGETDGAEQLVQLFGWNKYFQNKQIYPGSKDTHINRISKACKIGLEDMLFFDDEQRNITDLERLGVVSILVKNGMTIQVLMDGLKTFSDKRV